MPVTITPLPPEQDPASQAVPAGWKSSELWLSVLAILVSAVASSGTFDLANPSHVLILKILGIAGSVLAALGYTASRGFLKGRVATGAAQVATAQATQGAVIVSPASAGPVVMHQAKPPPESSRIP